MMSDITKRDDKYRLALFAAKKKALEDGIDFDDIFFTTYYDLNEKKKSSVSKCPR